MTAPRVVALVREPEEQARISGAIRNRGGALVPCASPNDVLTALAEGPAVAVVVAAYGPSVPEAVELTRTLRARHPTLPVLIYHDPRSTSPRHLLAFFQAGAAEVVQKGEDFRHAFAAILSAAGNRVAARRLMEKLAPLLPPESKPLFEYLLEKGDTPLTIDQAAAAVGVARRTLEKRLARLGYPAPESLIGWCRLLLAAHLLQEQGRTYDEVALELSFPSGMALRSMLKRYTGVSGREARGGQGPVALVLTHLKEQISTPQAKAALQRSRSIQGAIDTELRY